MVQAVKTVKIGIIAGEASGDSNAAFLMRELRSLYPDAIFEGVGGPKMQAAGCRCLYSINDLSFMGITDVLLHLPRVLKIRRALINHFVKQKIDLFIGVDFPDFNLSIAQALKKTSIKTAHYISPTIWAWRPRRIKKIKRAVDVVLGIYPFEKKCYENTGVSFYFVGHPLTRQIKGPFNAALKRKQLGLSEEGKTLALLPGSRTHEIERLAKDFILTAQECMQNNAHIECVAALTDDVHAAQFEAIWQRVAPSASFKIIVNQTHAVLEAADVVLLSSGTATLEALLFEKPMVVAYRLDWVSYWIGRMMLYVKYIALPNILASTLLVPEFIQNKVTVKNLTDAVMPYFDNPEKSQLLINQYRQIRQTLEQDIDAQNMAIVLKKLIDR
jgi:lipid-A-disaccharide synthase